MGLVGAAHSATNTVTSLADNGPGSLRQVIRLSPPSATIIFGVTGTIILTNGELAVAKDLTICGPGASALAISGNYQSRILNVSQSANVFISGLTIGNGQAAYGGGICNTGTLSLINCIISGNSAGWGSASGGNGGDGGGIYNLGTLNMSGSTISGNRAGEGADAGGAGSPGDGGNGGGVFLGGGYCDASNCIFSGNSAGSGGQGHGETPTSYMYGGPGATGGNGGGIYAGAGGALIINCTFTNNRAGVGGSGGMGQAYSGSGGSGGSGGGVCASNTLTMSGCTIVGNIAGSGGSSFSNFGGSGSGGMGGVGGGICAGEGLLLTNCTIVGNSGGNGGYGEFLYSSAYGGSGGGIYSCSTNEVIVACTVVSNSVGLGATGATNGIGGGICSALVGGPVLLNSIVALNSGDSPDVAGAFQSQGHNLIGVTNGSSGFSAPGDLVGSTNLLLNPKLGPLADNGGPTLTMALLPGSPAIDAGSAVGSPPTDQRGVLRPQGPGVDIGAFEYRYLPVFTGATMLSATNCRLQMAGLPPNQTYSLQVSTNLLNWWDVTNFMAGSNGVFQCVDPIAGATQLRFYRLKSSTP